MNDTPEVQNAKSGLTRRRLLGSAATVGALAAVDSALPANIRKAVAAGPARNGKLSDIKHVVLLMQENRSFDHYFGTLSGIRGFSDPKAAKLPNGDPVYKQPDPGGRPHTSRVGAGRLSFPLAGWDLDGLVPMLVGDLRSPPPGSSRNTASRAPAAPGDQGGFVHAR